MDETVLVDETRIELLRGDITEVAVDALVNAANTTLLGGGGVDGAIHRTGGPSILEECRTIGGCAIGEAVITTAGDLPARFVIHTVGPVWHGGSQGEPHMLSACYRNSLRLATEHTVLSLAFPSISTGVYGYPIAAAARIALETVVRTRLPASLLRRIVFVLFSDHDLDVYRRTLPKVLSRDP